ncbi:MAG: rhodanese-like domain-containing protein [Myxococcota bacterium]
MRRRVFQIGAACASGLLSIVVGVYVAFPWLGWSFVRWSTTGVPSISGPELARSLKSDSPPVLLDVRTREEFDVSHLPGAIHFPPGAPIDEAVRSAAELVVYCSVGVRSARELERLRAEGISSVRNLEGSIFDWAENDRPLVNSAGPTERVHPYDRLWGRLLARDRHAYE